MNEECQLNVYCVMTPPFSTCAAVGFLIPRRCGVLHQTTLPSCLSEGHKLSRNRQYRWSSTVVQEQRGICGLCCRMPHFKGRYIESARHTTFHTAEGTLWKMGKRKRGDGDDEGPKWNAHKNKSGNITEGCWASEEDELLMRTFDQICEDKEWNDEQRLTPFVENAKAAGYGALWKKLADPFPSRTLRSVQRRAMKLFHPGNNKGKWTPDELKKLRMLVAQHGTAWSIVGKELQRFPNSCRVTYERMQLTGSMDGVPSSESGLYVGSWGESEEIRLCQAVAQYGTLDTGALLQPAYKDIPWSAVSAAVGTRSAVQCSSKWSKLHDLASVDSAAATLAGGAGAAGGSSYLVEGQSWALSFLGHAKKAAEEKAGGASFDFGHAGVNLLLSQAVKQRPRPLGDKGTGKAAGRKTAGKTTTRRPSDSGSSSGSESDEEGGVQHVDPKAQADLALVQAIQEYLDEDEDGEIEQEQQIEWASVCNLCARHSRSASAPPASVSQAQASWASLRRSTPGAGQGVSLETAVAEVRKALQAKCAPLASARMAGSASSGRAGEGGRSFRPQTPAAAVASGVARAPSQPARRGRTLEPSISSSSSSTSDSSSNSSASSDRRGRVAARKDGKRARAQSSDSSASSSSSDSSSLSGSTSSTSSSSSSSESSGS